MCTTPQRSMTIRFNTFKKLSCLQSRTWRYRGTRSWWTRSRRISVLARLAPGTRLLTHRQLAARDGHGAGDRVTRVRRTGGHGPGERRSPAVARSSAISPCPPVTASTSRRWPPDVVDLNFNYPSLPGQADMLRHALRELAASGDVESLLRYQPHRGRPGERATVARSFGATRASRGSDRVLIVNGAQHGLAVAAMATLQPGTSSQSTRSRTQVSKFLPRRFGWKSPRYPLRRRPRSRRPAPFCAQRPVCAVYVMPTLHNPLGWVMTDATRAATRRRSPTAHRFLIIEDASYTYLVEEPPPPLASLAPDITVYVSGLSKIWLGSGVRSPFLRADTTSRPAGSTTGCRLCHWHARPRQAVNFLTASAVTGVK